MNWTCQLCNEPVEVGTADDLIHHLRLMHPDRFDHDLDFERWPDGEVVVQDMTLTPQDFTTKEQE